MLVLTRTKSQKITIEVGGQTLELTVLDVRGDRVRLGFTAPESFRIRRCELDESPKPAPAPATPLPGSHS